MTIIRAEKAGFCFGVNRAIDMTVQAALQENTASLGPLIHNQQVVDFLAEKGIEEVGTIDELRLGQQLVIRSHGVPPNIYDEAKNKGIKIIDATCPYVQKAQNLAKKSSKDSFVIVVGDRTHPEVIGILGWAGEKAQAVETLEEAIRLPHFPSIAVLAQTTQRQSNFTAIVEELKKHTDELIIHNTICRATEERQAFASDLADKVDLMIVVGGKSSSNTKKLGAICGEKVTTYVIETANELKEIWFQGVTTVGLTAGASTPDWIIEEVYNKMSEILDQANTQPTEEATMAQQEENMMDAYANELPSIYGGAIVKGIVVKINNDEAFVDIAWKSEGVIPIEEIAATKVTNIHDVLQVGDQVTAMVIKAENKEGHTVLSRKRVVEFEAREKLAKLAETGEEVQAKVSEVTKGGLIVDMGMRGFVPASQIELGFVEDLNKYIGKTLRLRVLEYDQGKRKLVLSQKAILAGEQSINRERLFETLKEGNVVKGTVKRLTSFGAFIDLGGVDGLLHVSDMAFSRVKNPADIVKVEDQVEVQVLSIDQEKGRISLGLKQLRENPWAKIEEKYPVGSIVVGKVARIATFGAFVEIEDGLDALVHISQISPQRVVKVDDVLKVGQEIQAKVIESKPEEKRISLSIKEMFLDTKKQEEQEMMEVQPAIPEVTIADSMKEVE